MYNSKGLNKERVQRDNIYNVPPANTTNYSVHHGNNTVHSSVYPKNFADISRTNKDREILLATDEAQQQNWAQQKCSPFDTFNIQDNHFKQDHIQPGAYQHRKTNDHMTRDQHMIQLNANHAKLNQHFADRRLNHYNATNEFKPCTNESVSIPFVTPGEYEVPNLLHNNLTPMAINETVFRHNIFIDSADRDFGAYKSPFNFRVIFNPNREAPEPHIFRKLDKVRYIRLQKAILPNKYNLEKTIVSDTDALLPPYSDLTAHFQALNPIVPDVKTTVGASDVVIIDSEQSNGTTRIEFFIANTLEGEEKTYTYFDDGISPPSYCSYEFAGPLLSSQRYVLLTIKEFDRVQKMSTNTKASKAFTILYPDSVAGGFLYTEFGYVDEVFKFSELGQINSMSISFCDSYGNQLQINNLDFKVKTGKEDEFTTVNGERIVKHASASRYIRHPLYLKLQTHLLFVIGVVENEIDKEIFS